DGSDVFVHSSALPEGVPALRPGQRVEFGVAEGRRGDQALAIRVLEAPPSVAKAKRKNPDEMRPIVEDLLKLADAGYNALTRRKYPADASKIAAVLRAVADDLQA